MNLFIPQDIWNLIQKYAFHMMYENVLEEYKLCSQISDNINGLIFWIDIIEVQKGMPYYKLFEDLIKKRKYENRMWISDDFIFENNNIKWEKYDTHDIANFKIFLR